MLIMVACINHFTTSHKRYESLTPALSKEEGALYFLKTSPLERI